MSDTVEQVKEKLGIVEVVSGYVKLTKAGKYHKGLCPFHKEKSPSFMVSPDRGFYHCFGCGKGGDIFSFVEDVENVDFKGALAILAEKAGVQLTHERTGDKDAREKLYAVLASAENFFKDTLQAHADAVTYLKGRGLSDEVIQAWRVGYAPNEWRSLSDALIAEGYTPSDIEAAGLSKKPEHEGENKKPYDRFRGRIMFPIRDVSGRVVGFSGRIFEDDPKHPQAKYVNSPETPVFHKSRILYGLSVAKQGIRKYGFALLVEGQIDLLMAHQMGFSNAVALSGTAFTKDHADLLRRYSDNLLIAFDGDTAGIAAAGRAAAIALQTGLNTKIATLPKDADPADTIAQDPQEFKRVVKEALHVVDFYLKHVRDSGYDDRRFKLEASAKVLPFVALIGNAIEKEHYIGKVAAALSVSEDAVRQELLKLKTNRSEPYEANVRTVQKKSEISHEPFLSRGDTIERLLLGLVRVFKDAGDEARYARVHTALVDTIGEEKVREALVEEERASLIEADMYLEEYADEGAKDAMIGELLSDFKRECVRREYESLIRELKRREAVGSGDIDALVAEIANLAKKL